MANRKSIPVIDLFAGPGGLGEGFSSLLDTERTPLFSLKVSAEKDPTAHKTLSLRSLYRKFPCAKAPDCYYEHIRGEISREALFAHPEAAEAGKEALEEALNFELGRDNPEDLDRRIQAAPMADRRIQHVEFRDDRFVAAVRLQGEINLFYRARVVTPGKFVVPPVYAEDMYRPDTYGLAEGDGSLTVIDGK